MAKKSKIRKRKDYFNMPRILSIIFAIIPFTSWVFGFVTRFTEGKILAGLIRCIFGFNIIWVLDLIFVILKGSIFRLLNL